MSFVKPFVHNMSTSLLARHLTAPNTRNNAGGEAYEANLWGRLDRFLIIGTEGGTFYASEKDLTIENARCVAECVNSDFGRTLSRIVQISKEGRAAKTSYAILALALSFAVDPSSVDETVREQRKIAVHEVCRTSSDLFMLISYVKELKNHTTALKKAVWYWLANRRPDALAYQATKYRNRYGYTWKDVLSLFRPCDFDKPDRKALYQWLVREEVEADYVDSLPRAVTNFNDLQTSEDVAQTLRDQKEMEVRPVWEWLPTSAMTDKEALLELIDPMPIKALIRNLSRFSAYGALAPKKDAILAKLGNVELAKAARLHPMNLFFAAHAYEAGRSRNLVWTPDSDIVDALDDAFHNLLSETEPSGKRVLVAIDSSGSMHQYLPKSTQMLHDVCAAMALVHKRVDNADIIAFDTQIKALTLSGRQRLTDAKRALDSLGMGGRTDCALPFEHALEDGGYDAIVCYTDGEDWVRSRRPGSYGFSRRVTPLEKTAAELRADFRGKVVWAQMTASRTTLARPGHAKTLDIAGFDAAAVKLSTDFIADRIN